MSTKYYVAIIVYKSASILCWLHPNFMKKCITLK